MDKITISVKEYERLMASAVFLNALKEEGLDTMAIYDITLMRLRALADAEGMAPVLESTVNTPLIGGHLDE